MRQGLRLFAAIATFSALAHPGAQQPPAQPPLRLAIAGLVHGHVSGFLRGAQGRGDVQIVGIYDPDAALVRQYGERYKLPDAALFTDLNAMLDRTKPEAVASFTNTLDHPAIVEAAAARHIDVMMEKPLAISNADAQRIKRAADRGGIEVFVNYETTWYPSHGAIWTLMKEKKACRRDPQDGRDGRPSRPESDQRAAGVLRLAVGSGQERRRRALRFRLLRREPDDVVDGQPAAGRASPP